VLEIPQYSLNNVNGPPIAEENRHCLAELNSITVNYNVLRVDNEYMYIYTCI